MVPQDGVPRRIAGFKGESLLEVLQRTHTPGIFADCGGGDNEYTFAPHQIPYDFYSMGVSCGQCSVHIAEPWFDKLNKMPSSEETRIKRRDGPNSQYTRLACCINIQPHLNEMIVVVGNNKTVSGDFFGGDNGN